MARAIHHGDINLALGIANHNTVESGRLSCLGMRVCLSDRVDLAESYDELQLAERKP
jgi:hypothetical protein